MAAGREPHCPAGGRGQGHLQPSLVPTQALHQIKAPPPGKQPGQLQLPTASPANLRFILSADLVPANSATRAQHTPAAGCPLIPIWGWRLRPGASGASAPRGHGSSPQTNLGCPVCLRVPGCCQAAMAQIALLSSCAGMTGRHKRLRSGQPCPAWINRRPYSRLPPRAEPEDASAHFFPNLRSSRAAPGSPPCGKCD